MTRKIDDPFWAGKGLVKSAADRLGAEKDLTPRVARVKSAVRAIHMQLSLPTPPSLKDVVSNLDACLVDLGKSTEKYPEVVKQVEDAKAAFEESMKPKEEVVDDKG